MKASQELIDFVADLQKEVATVGRTTSRINGYDKVDSGKLAGLVSGCRLLITKLGPFGKVWDEMLQPPEINHKSALDKISGVIDTIANALAKGRLSTMEELVGAEVLGDLLEHAEVLLKANYNLAAAIILRAVLEERLRKLCTSNSCAQATAAHQPRRDLQSKTSSSRCIALKSSTRSG